MVKIWELTQQRRWQRRAAGYDLVVLDAPATGHALGMLRSPRHVRRDRARRSDRDAGRARCASCSRTRRARAYLGVAQGTEMAVTETLELQDGLSRPARARASTR